MNKKKRHLELRDKREKEEFRRFPVEELRVVREDEGQKIVGYAAVFDKWSEDLGGFREKIRKGAFAKSLEKDDVRALWNHNSDFVLGRNKNGTLILEEDKRGLRVEIDPPKGGFFDGFLESIERGDVSQMSFGFYTVSDEWNYNEGTKKIAERELIEAELFDVSPVTYPAYPQTKVAVRSAVDEILHKVESGNELSEEDQAQVQSAIDKLQASLPVPDAPPEEGNDPVSQDLNTKIALEIESEM